jgi:tetratricopeptide (TPR) repeat protein
MAGFGFDLLFQEIKTSGWRKFLQPAFGVVAMGFFILAGVLIFLCSRHDQVTAFFQSLSGTYSVQYFEHFSTFCKGSWVDGFPYAIRVAYDPMLLILRLAGAAGVAVGAGIFFILLFLKRTSCFRQVVVCGLLSLCLIDIFGYKLTELRIRTLALSVSQARLFDFQKAPYPHRRSLLSSQEAPRSVLLREVAASYPLRKWILNSFLFNDTAGSIFFTGYWLSPFDRFLRAAWGQTLGERSSKYKGVFEGPNSFKFPLGKISVRKMAGIDEDKIQFFENAYQVTDEDLAMIFRQEDFSGDLLFVSKEGKSAELEGVIPWSQGKSLSLSERKLCPYQVKRFDANHLDIEVVCPSDKGLWLFYADVWHPFWQATVNGKRVAVLRADLAYKAIFLEPGKNIVRFYFGSKEIVLYQLLFCFLAAWFIVFLLKRTTALFFCSRVLGKEIKMDCKIFGMFFLVALLIVLGVDRKMDGHLSRPRTKDLLTYLNKFAGGDTLYRQKEFVRGQELYEKMAYISPRKALVLANYAFCSFYAQDISKAFEFYQKALSQDEEVYTFVYDLGLMALETRRYQEALSFFEQSLPLAILNREYYKMRITQIEKDDEEPETLYNEFVTLGREADKDIEFLYILQADGQKYFKNFSAMMKVCIEGLTQYPQSQALLFRLGLAQMAFRQFDAARVSFSRVAEKDSSYRYDKISRLRKICDMAGGGPQDAVAREELEQDAARWGDDPQGKLPKLHFYGQKAPFFLFHYTVGGI